MKTLQYIISMVFICSLQGLSADASRGFWGWITDVTSSAWEGTKNTVRAFFGGERVDGNQGADQAREPQPANKHLADKQQDDTVLPKK